MVDCLYGHYWRSHAHGTPGMGAVVICFSVLSSQSIHQGGALVDKSAVHLGGLLFRPASVRAVFLPSSAQRGAELASHEANI
jgi:hypothetical protein